MWSLKEIDRAAWNGFWPRIRHANLLQSWEYGNAKQKAQGWQPCRFLIQDDTGNPRGLVQVLTRSIPWLGGGARLNRGPLWFSICPTEEQTLADVYNALAALLRMVQHRRWWYFRLAPEVILSNKSKAMLTKLGLKPAGGEAWGSAMISLKATEDELFKNLEGKWRNLLRKALRFELHIESSATPEDIETMIASYHELQKRAGFQGIPEGILRRLSAEKGQRFTYTILWARTSKHTPPIGFVLAIGHGDTATYCSGWTSPEGRELQAGYQLLWHAILMYKNKGYDWFDLGGINAGTTKGIAHFKAGLGGIRYTLIGEFKWHMGPIRKVCKD